MLQSLREIASFTNSIPLIFLLFDRRFLWLIKSESSAARNNSFLLINERDKTCNAVLKRFSACFSTSDITVPSPSRNPAIYANSVFVREVIFPTVTSCVPQLYHIHLGPSPSIEVYEDSTVLDQFITLKLPSRREGL